MHFANSKYFNNNTPLSKRCYNFISIKQYIITNKIHTSQIQSVLCGCKKMKLKSTFALPQPKKEHLRQGVCTLFNTRALDGLVHVEARALRLRLPKRYTVEIVPPCSHGKSTCPVFLTTIILLSFCRL